MGIRKWSYCHTLYTGYKIRGIKLNKTITHNTASFSPSLPQRLSLLGHLLLSLRGLRLGDLLDLAGGDLSSLLRLSGLLLDRSGLLRGLLLGLTLRGDLRDLSGDRRGGDLLLSGLLRFISGDGSLGRLFSGDLDRLFSGDLDRLFSGDLDRLFSTGLWFLSCLLSTGLLLLPRLAGGDLLLPLSARGDLTRVGDLGGSRRMFSLALGSELYT